MIMKHKIIFALVILILVTGCSSKEKICNAQNTCSPSTYNEFTFYDIDSPFDTDELCRMAKQIASNEGYSLNEECLASNVQQTVKGYGVVLQVSKRMKNYQLSMIVAKETESLNYFFTSK